jgi:protease IV
MQAGRHPWLWGMVGTALMFAFFFLVTFLLTVLLTGEEGITDGRTKIGVIQIEGVISSDLSERTVRQLTKYGDDASIKAIILRIESPGGGVASSQEIYEEVSRVRSGGKLVVASLGSVAASGGYYVACTADRIFANAGTLTGSIGVIVQLANAEELLRKVGVASTVITSGPFKDSGNPTRTLRPEERQVFQALVDDVYQQFVEAVAQGRNLPLDEVRQAADGRIYTGRQARDLRLVDELGSMEDAIAYAASTLGIVGKPKLVREGKERLWWLRFLFESLSDASVWTPFSKAEAVLQYRWPY